MSNGNPEDDREPQPWSQQSAPQLEQAESPPQAAGQSADERALSDYISPGEGRASLVGMLGGQPSDSGAGTGLAGGGMGALMLPLLMAQMQQQQRQATSPLSAFANAYSGATGQRSPLQAPQGMSQYQQFEVMHSLIKDQRQAQVDQARQEAIQATQKRLEAAAADKQTQTLYTNALKQADANIAIAKTHINDPDDTIRVWALDRLTDGYKAKGVPVPEGALDGLRNKRWTTKELEDGRRMLAEDYDPNLVATKFGFTPQVMEEMKGAVDLLVKRTRVKDDTDAAKLKKAEFDVIAERAPELKDPRLSGYFTQQARSEGKNVLNSSDEDFSRWRNAAITAANGDTLKLKEAESKILQNQQIAVAQATGGIHLANAKALEQFKWDNTPAALLGKPFMNASGQTASTQQMQQSQRALAAQGFFVAEPAELKQVNTIQSLKVQMENVQNAVEKVNELGGFATREGRLAKIPVVGPLAENFASGLGVQRVTTSSPALMTALGVLEQKKADMVRFARENGDNLRALGAVTPDMNVVDTNRGYATVKQVLSDMTNQMKAAVTKSRTPGAWDSDPKLIPSQEAQLSAKGQAMYNNAEARLKALPLPPDELKRQLDAIRQKLTLGAY